MVNVHPMRTALRLADLVLCGGSVDAEVGTTAVNGFLLNMPTPFEHFVTVALGQELRRHGGMTDKPTVRLDVDRLVRMVPDLDWWRAGDSIAVVDAKYKAEKV